MIIVSPLPYIIGMILVLFNSLILYSCLSAPYRTPLYWLMVIISAIVPGYNMGIGITVLIFLVIVRKRVYDNSRSKLVKWLFKSRTTPTKAN